MSLQENTYNRYADEYAAMLQNWKESGYSHYHSLVIPQVLEMAGDVAGRMVLDAGCGEGHLARLLTEHGAHVTAVDVAARLVELGRAHDQTGSINYLVQDLSKGLPHYDEHFDLVVSNFVLNDVYDYAGYISTLGQVTKPGGRLVLSFNNPYAVVFRGKAPGYFASGTVALYQALSEAGVSVYNYHQTFEDYITAFRRAGFLLRSLVDLHATRPVAMANAVIEEPLPFIIVLELVKIHALEGAGENTAWR